MSRRVTQLTWRDLAWLVQAQGVCLGYDPLANPGGGRAGGDGLCLNGYGGPLCSVCAANHYKLGGTCKYGLSLDISVHQNTTSLEELATMAVWLLSCMQQTTTNWAELASMASPNTSLCIKTLPLWRNLQVWPSGYFSVCSKPLQLGGTCKYGRLGTFLYAANHYKLGGTCKYGLP